MPNICLGNLLPSSVLAYDNIDLIPNGYIPETGTTARPRTRNQGGQIISEREVIRLLPADRLYAEFWFGVRTRVTGTSLNDLSPGGNTGFIFGTLGGGAGFGIGSALGCSLQGDAERTLSRWTFHVCDSETRLNREVVLTQENITSKQIILPDYVLGVLGITRAPIVFVTPDTPLTEEQIARARATPADEVEQRLGRRVAPIELTDSDMRILLGLSDLNELENLGNSGGRIRGWPQSPDGQIQAEFENYKYSDATNLFTGIVRDERKNRYRADNEFDRTNGHCFWNGSTDDLTDKVVSFNLSEQTDPNNPPPADAPPTVALKAGDKVYISYVGGTPLFRHAIENITNFFLFPDQSVYQLPPLDLVKGWNFKKFKFKVRKNSAERAALADFVNDAEIQSQILEIQNNASLTETEKTRRIQRLTQRILLTDMECQRLIESKLEKANRNQFIMGCYFADSRGILSCSFRNNNEVRLLIPRASIRDQAWFDSFLQEVQSTSNAFDSSGQLILGGDEARAFFDDFLFDISDHVNSVCYDNEKFGYERRLAKALSNCTVYNKDEPNTGVGFANLDLIKSLSPGRDDYDLTSAKFDSVPMQGSGTLYTCNVTFTYDFGFCTKGTIQADMLLRTPTFLQGLSSKSRIYVEKFQAVNPIRGDGAIWVGTRPAFTENYAVTTDPKKYQACLVYPDSSNGTTNFRVFEEGVINKDFSEMERENLTSEGHTLPQLDTSLTGESIKYGGYDNLIGDQPGYYRGIEISTENALILMSKVSPTIIKIDKLVFTRDQATGRINVAGLSGRRLRKITIKYIPNNRAFLDDSKRMVSFVFPSSKNVVDNVAIPYQGSFKKDARIVCVDTRYINAESWFIDGDILKYMDIEYIEAESLEEEEYQKYKISTSNVTTCFDPSGRWLVFYEDEKGGEGDTSNNGLNADGSHLVGPHPDGAMPGLQEQTVREISCLLSPDYGYTWYDFKGLVRTVVGESVSAPYAVMDDFSNKIHLFYVLNDALMHKEIDASLFVYEDAFLAYKRPNRLDENTLAMYGLYHFSEAGQKLRATPSNIVVGNVAGDYLQTQLATTEAMRNARRTDYRIALAGDEKNYEEGFPDVDFIAFRDSSGQFKVLFVANGRLYCRGSSNGGAAWYDFFEEGLLVHKNSDLQELKSIKLLGFAIDYKSDVAYLTYQTEGMLFIRNFISKASIASDVKIQDILGPDSETAKPVFVVGAISPELKTAIKNKETNVVFPYGDVDVFGDGFSISETPSIGYSTGNGFLRFFYKDASGSFRAFSYPETPILDIEYAKRE